MYNDKLISIILQHHGNIFYHVFPTYIYYFPVLLCLYFPFLYKILMTQKRTHFSHGLWHQKPATLAAATSRISHLIFKTILGGLMLQNYYYYLVALEYFDAFDIYWQHPTTTYHVLMHICCALSYHLILSIFFYLKKIYHKKNLLVPTYLSYKCTL